jgi:hypothetical protein
MRLLSDLAQCTHVSGKEGKATKPATEICSPACVNPFLTFQQRQISIKKFEMGSVSYLLTISSSHSGPVSFRCSSAGKATFSLNSYRKALAWGQVTKA